MRYLPVSLLFLRNKYSVKEYECNHTTLIMKNRTKLLSISTAFLFLMFPVIVWAQTVKSNCVVTKIGNPGDQKPVLPPECSSPVGQDGMIYPPNMVEHPTRKGYFQLPFPSPASGSYESYSCANQSWGSKELVGVLYTVAERWKQKYPQGRLNIGDLNASGHASHKWGRGVDMNATTNGVDWVANFVRGNYNEQATIELGQMFADTNMIQNIWYMGQPVINSVLAYANDPANPNRSAGLVMQPLPLHDDHFHIDIKLDPFLEVWEPDC